MSSSKNGRPRGVQFVLLVLFAAACAGPSQPRRNRSFEPPATVSFAETMKPPAMDPEIELELLARHKTTPALLRSAWLLLQLDNTRAAIDATAEVLYGPVKASANDEAFARYLRAEAYQRSGLGERAEWDRQQALALANDPELRRRLGAVQKSAPAAATPELASELVIQPRSAWNARAVDRSNVDAMGGIRRVTIHHSAMYFRDTRPSTCAAQIQKIQREHMSGRKYGDIGYHFLIDPSGRIWAGRDLRYQGAHADGDNNKHNVGICLLGNFMRGRDGQAPTAAQVRSMRLLTASVMRKNGIGPDEVYQHSDFKATDCPGVVMEPIVDQMVRDLHRQGVSAMVEAAGQ